MEVMVVGPEMTMGVIGMEKNKINGEKPEEASRKAKIGLSMRGMMLGQEDIATAVTADKMEMQKATAEMEKKVSGEDENPRETQIKDETLQEAIDAGVTLDQDLKQMQESSDETENDDLKTEYVGGPQKAEPVPVDAPESVLTREMRETNPSVREKVDTKAPTTGYEVVEVSLPEENEKIDKETQKLNLEQKQEDDEKVKERENIFSPNSFELKPEEILMTETKDDKKIVDELQNQEEQKPTDKQMENEKQEESTETANEEQELRENDNNDELEIESEDKNENLMDYSTEETDQYTKTLLWSREARARLDKFGQMRRIDSELKNARKRRKNLENRGA